MLNILSNKDLKYSQNNQIKIKITGALRNRPKYKFINSSKPKTKPTQCPLELSNIELIRVCSQSTQSTAWEEFYRRFDKYITIYVKKAWKRRMSTDNIDNISIQETLKDIVQDVYIKLLEADQQALKSFQGQDENTFFAYLARIATNQVGEYFRRQLAEKRKGATLSVDFLLDSLACERSCSQRLAYEYLSRDIEPALINRIAWQEFSDILEQLLEGPQVKRDKLVFLLHISEKLSSQEIATKLGGGLKASGVESIIRRTKDRLQRIIKHSSLQF